jgi:ketosteroid isomerase-like protein
MGEFEAISVQAKHIAVLTLVEGQAAVAHYYTEGSMTPKGYPTVSNYLVRVTQVFVKEDGTWKIRSSHWSAITGGSGTSQTAE